MHLFDELHNYIVCSCSDKLYRINRDKRHCKLTMFAQFKILVTIFQFCEFPSQSFVHDRCIFFANLFIRFQYNFFVVPVCISYCTWSPWFVQMKLWHKQWERANFGTVIRSRFLMSHTMLWIQLTTQMVNSIEMWSYFCFCLFKRQKQEIATHKRFCCLLVSHVWLNKNTIWNVNWRSKRFFRLALFRLRHTHTSGCLLLAYIASRNWVHCKQKEAKLHFRPHFIPSMIIFKYTNDII